MLRITGVACEGDSCSFEQTTQTFELVVGERVHGVYEHGLGARSSLVTQAIIDNGNEERFGLAAACRRGDNGWLAIHQALSRTFLVIVERPAGEATCCLRNQYALAHQLHHRRA